MKKLIVLSLFTFFCATTNAQETIPNSSIDSLRTKLKEQLTDNCRVYFRGTATGWDGLYEVNISIPKIEFLREKEVRTTYLYETFLLVKTPGRFGEDLYIQYNNLSIHKYSTYNINWTSLKKAKAETIAANKKITEIFENIQKLRNHYFIEDLNNFQKEVAIFKQSNHSVPLTEEQRKYIVQANAANKAMNYEKAIELYTTVAKINPTSYPEGYYNMALIAAEMKNYSFAIFNMKKYLIISPDASDARAAQDKIYEWELNIK